MASYFGEVLETSSRAFIGDDDADYYDSLKRQYEISWISSDRPEDVDLFLVVVGKSCRAFSALLRQKSSPELIARVVPIAGKDNEEESAVRKRKEVPSCIYKFKSRVLICEVSPDVHLINANRFTFKIHELLAASKEVIVITSLSSNRYLSLSDHSPPFMKGIASSIYYTGGKEVLAPPLETPNIVTGVAASVLTFCEVKKIPGCLYICYTPNEDIDSSIFCLFQKLFSQVHIMKSAVDDLKYESKDVDCFTLRTGNMYL